MLNDAAHEALVNAHKHSGMPDAVIRVGTEGDLVVVTIHDNGRGFDPEAPSGGFGVTESIQRRLTEAGGTAVIDSTPGVGTTVTLRMVRQ